MYNHHLNSKSIYSVFMAVLVVAISTLWIGQSFFYGNADGRDPYVVD